MDRYNVYKVGNPGCKFKKKLHDKGLIRALNADYCPKVKIDSVPYRTVFVYNLDFGTGEEVIRKKFERFGEVVSLNLVRDVVSGESKGYCFIEFACSYQAELAYKKAHKMIVDGRRVFVDWERSRVQDGWVPRRLGGGLGGKKQSRQLRFKY